MYDLAIIGGGPAGVSAGVYAARKRLRTVFITGEWGGQSTVSDGIENWIGTVKISGAELADALKTHLEAYKGDIVDIVPNTTVSGVEKTPEGFVVKTDDDKSFTAKTVLIATGSTRRKLTIPGADKFEHKGVTYCASCDGPMFADQDVVVIGGGNAGFESAAQLLAYAKSVTLLQRGTEYRADPVTVEKVLKHPNMRGITNTELVEVKGEQFTSGLVYKDLTTDTLIELPCTGIFVEIGLIPSTSYVKDLVTLNTLGQIEIDPWTQKTSIEGVWAAGYCTNVPYHQNNIASGDGVKALEDIYQYIHAK